jgi:hypothetical protein
VNLARTEGSTQNIDAQVGVGSDRTVRSNDARVSER